LAEEEDFIQDVELAIAEADAGQVVDHEVAAAYLRSLGTDSPLPMPRTKHL
jgi:predicted transcriptional regulator